MAHWNVKKKKKKKKQGPPQRGGFSRGEKKREKGESQMLERGEEFGEIS